MSWALADAARDTWQRFRAGWADLPRHRRTRFAWTLTAGWVGLAALMLAMTVLMREWIAPRIEGAEAGWLVRIVAAAPLDFQTAVFLESPGNGVVLIPLAIALAIAHARRADPLLALATLAACLMPAVVVGLGWTVWERDRPDFLYPGLPPSTLSAFPSGHSAMAVPFYGLIAYLWARDAPGFAERALIAVILAAVLGTVLLARLVLGAHWPSDVVGGVLIGALWLGVVVGALRYADPAPFSPHR